MPKKNEILTLKIENITNLGFGVARYEGLVIFVAGAVTGDEVLAKIIKVTPSYAIARIEKILISSPLRVNDRCGYDRCTSCAYKLISYAEECKIKENDVKEAFIKAGIYDAEISDIVPSPNVFEYRNKAQYPITKSPDGEYIIGYYAPKSHRVCEARFCPLTPRVFGEICDTVATFAKKHAISVYDEKSGSGLLRHIYIRRGEVTGEILLTLVINGDTLPFSEALCADIREKFSDVVGILINVNREKTNIILGKEYKALWGRDYIYDVLAGVRLKIKPSAFYQVNHAAAELLYKKAGELADLKGGEVLLDLYCGTGSIGLSMAKGAKSLVGVEIVEDAVACARENAQNSGIENALFFASPASDTEQIFKDAEQRLGKIAPDVVILDPPRSGCDEATVKFVAGLNPQRIVYISCNPQTLARDVKLFTTLGYTFGNITPFDLFPATGHVESVVCLTRK